MTLLAIDPGRSAKGDASIGWCLWSEEEVGDTGRLAWQEIQRGSLSFEDLQCDLRISPGDNPFLDDPWDRTSYDLLFKNWMVDEVVVENFVNNEKSRGGQTNGTSECIGAIETYCYITRTPFTRQEPAALGPAKLHAPEGGWKPLKHLRHEDSAFLHGYEYLVRKGVLQSAGLDATM